MERLNSMVSMKLRTRLCGVSRLSTLCGVLATLVLVTGCPPGGTQPEPCTTAADCDDGNFCNGAETCVAQECADGTAACTAPEVCDEAAERCEECGNEGQAACSDGDNCTTDACGADGQCTATAVACPDEFCNPADGACVECLVAADCDDAVFCNGPETCGADNACADGAAPCDPATEVCREALGECSPIECATNADCDNTIFCDGPEVCVEQLCLDGPDPCAEPTPVCDETGGVCVDCLTNADCTAPETCVANVCSAAPPCTTDADCDDALFCNGAETCDLVTLVCVAATDPCDDGNFCNGVESCTEDTDTCGDGPDPCDPVTQSCDDVNDVCTEIQIFILTEDVDILNGSEAADVFRGTDVTADTGDLLNGRGGIDRFDWITADDENDLLDCVGIEHIFFRNTFAGQDINLSGFDGFQQLWFDRGTEDLLLDNVPAIAAVGYTGGDGDGNFEVVFDDPVTDGDADTLEIFLDDADGDDLTFDGFEIFNVDLTGDSELTSLNSNDLETVNFLGGSSLVVDDVIAGAETLDASGSIADIDIAVDDLDVAYTGGSGQDVVTFGTGEFDDDDAFDGGDGDSDQINLVLSASVTVAGAAGVPITNTELLSVRTDASAGAFTLDLGGVDGLTTVRIEEVGTAGTLTLDDMDLGPSLVFRGDGDDANQIFDNLTIDFTGADGSADPLAIEVNNRGDDGEDLDDAPRTITLATLDIDDIEDVSIEIVDGGDMTITTLNGQDVESLIITANSSLTITNPLESTEVTSVDATASTGDVVVDISDATGDASMIGGDGDDTLTGGDGEDDIDGGDGDDTLSGLAAANVLTGGADEDVFILSDNTTTLVTDWDAADDRVDFDLSALVAAIPGDFVLVGAGATSIVAGTASDVQELAAAAAASATATVFVLTGTTFANTGLVETALEAAGTRALTTDGNVNANDLFTVVYSDGNDAFVAVAKSAAGDGAGTTFPAADLTVTNIGRLDDVDAIGAGDFGDNDFDYID